MIKQVSSNIAKQSKKSDINKPAYKFAASNTANLPVQNIT
ncbi:hypothetical protein SALWKB12_0050 [Snodgrassella communis]|uniref:Uncharacterized protein n=1 Tax=Snodgrassella communis TaxID=2946699 RepID=A0A836MP61_9NEIS|nr:hypothetical protein SALWKB12_0050 [Snodgrassella communis]KDN14431.1 hypothetical protein SALWKB29_1520 [Snodgrassella communis]